MIIVVLMCLFAFLARKYYRLKEEGSRVYKLSDGPYFNRQEDKPLAHIYTPPRDAHPNKVLLKQPTRSTDIASA